VVELSVEGLEHSVVPWNITQFREAKHQDVIYQFLQDIYKYYAVLEHIE
jgi:hypothetical protein